MPHNLKHWNLLKYSRFKPDPKAREPLGECKPGAKGSWISQEVRAGGVMRLSLTVEGHVLITNDDTVLESVFLLSGASNPRSCKVLQKNDVLSFLCKVQHEARMFRVQFAGKEILEASFKCKDCAECLSKYVSVRFSEGNPEAPQTERASTNEQRLAEPNLCQLVDTIMKNDLARLPLLYQQCTKEQASTDDQAGLQSLVMLCFTDPTFPSFVGRVETIVKDILNDANNIDAL